MESAGIESSRLARCAGLVERLCGETVQYALPLILTVAGALGLYVLGGFLALQAGWTPPYTFMGMNSDPIFNLLSTTLGIVVCLETGSLIILWMMHEPNDRDNLIALLAAFAGFGAGAGLLRMTVHQSWAAVIHVLLSLL
jgi:hypothetical protein